MNSLLYGGSSSASIERKTLTLKSSGARTPAPTSKVLRWKDLEATAAAEAAMVAGQGEDISMRSVFGTEEGRHDFLNMGESREDELFEVEELFV